MRMGTPSTENGWTMVNPGLWTQNTLWITKTTKHFLENIVSFPCQKYQAVCLEHEVFTLYNAENSNHSFLQNDIWNCFFYNMTYRNLGLENARSMRIIETFQTMDINTISQEMECYGMMTLCHWCPALHLFKKTLKPGSYPQNLQNGSFDVIWICLHSMLTKWVRPVQHYEIGFRQYDSTNVHCSAWSPPSRKRIVWQSGRTLRKKTNQHVFFRRCVFQKVQVHEQQSSRKCLRIPSPSHENQPLSNPIPIKHPNGPNSSQWCGNSIHPPWFRPPAFPKASLTGALSSVASHPYGFDKQDLYPIILNHIDHYI